MNIAEEGKIRWVKYFKFSSLNLILKGFYAKNIKIWVFFDVVFEACFGKKAIFPL